MKPQSKIIYSQKVDRLKQDIRFYIGESAIQKAKKLMISTQLNSLQCYQSVWNEFLHQTL